MSYKRQRVLSVLTQHGVTVIRDTGPHTIVGKAGGPYTSLPRHKELNRFTVRAIVRQLELEWAIIEKDLK